MKTAQAGGKAMILGAYGLIGSACLRSFQAVGYDVIGVGRDASAAARIKADWLIMDIASATPADWTRAFERVDVVINVSGALQSGARDNLTAIHDTAIQNMIEGASALSTPPRFIQISAAGVSPDASTDFFVTKARGDAALMASPLDWIILRPTLVLGRAAYGGTALLRAASALPGIGFRVLPHVQVQTVALDDLTQAVLQAAKGDIPSGTLADITAPDSHSFGALTDDIRQWQGFAPWRVTLNVPTPLLGLTAKGADALGWLGWRSPLRSTALTVLKDGIHGDPAPWIAAGGTPCRSLQDTLRDQPATVQDRWFARLFLLLPVAIGTLSLFWLLSGLIGLIQADVAMATLTTRGISGSFAGIAVIGGAFLDILLGTAVLWRKQARRACLGMIALSAAYLLGGTLLTPDIWADPLGPFVKVLPAMALSALTAALLEDR